MRMRRLHEDTMTAREHVLATIDGTEVDRVPIFEFIQHKDLCGRVTGKQPSVDNGMELLLATIRECVDPCFTL